VRVAALGNYTRAAEELPPHPAGGDPAGARPERHFALRLVEVVGRRPLLTEAGRYLAARATDLLATWRAEREMGEFAEARARRAAVGAN